MCVWVRAQTKGGKGMITKESANNFLQGGGSQRNRSTAPFSIGCIARHSPQHPQILGVNLRNQVHRLWRAGKLMRRASKCPLFPVALDVLAL
jgi:hypothetical protein